MSEYQTKDFTGVLFKNDKREKDSQPQAKGSAVIDGREYWVSAWTNKSAKGTVYQSLKFTAKDEVHNAGMANAKQALDDGGRAYANQMAEQEKAKDAFADAMDDDIPF